jgi:hypothetical protein
MAAAQIFNIENGVLALTLVQPGDDPTWQSPGGLEADAVTAATYDGADGIVFSCQVQSGMLTASPNTTDKTTNPTFCEPEVTTTQVGVTSYALELTALQDPHVADGISFFAFKNDTKLAYFALGLNTWGAPKAIGKCRIVAGTFGGAAREDLTTDISMPVETKPDIQFGLDAGWTIVHGDGSADTEGTTAAATTATAGTPGSFDGTPPASPAALIAGTPNVVTASPTSAWTTGQYVQTGTAGAAGHAYWNGTAWTNGTAAKAAAASSSKSAPAAAAA